MTSPGRILAIDYGARRMGLAVSDPLGITAQGLETLQRKNKRSDFARLEKTIREYQVQEIVLGNCILASEPGHPFWGLALAELESGFRGLGHKPLEEEVIWLTGPGLLDVSVPVQQ